MFSLKHCPFVFLYPGQGDNFSPKKKKSQSLEKFLLPIPPATSDDDEESALVKVSTGDDSRVFCPVDSCYQSVRGQSRGLKRASMRQHMTAHRKNADLVSNNMLRLLKLQCCGGCEGCIFATDKRSMGGRATNDYKSYSICTSLVNKTAIHGLLISIPSQGSFFLRQQGSCHRNFFWMIFLAHFAQPIFRVHKKSVCKLSPLGGRIFCDRQKEHGREGNQRL